MRYLRAVRRLRELLLGTADPSRSLSPDAAAS